MTSQPVESMEWSLVVPSNIYLKKNNPLSTKQREHSIHQSDRALKQPIRQRVVSWHTCPVCVWMRCRVPWPVPTATSSAQGFIATHVGSDEKVDTSSLVQRVKYTMTLNSKLQRVSKN